ncbi:MAG TPA: hypothetical protein PLL10_02295 [Elusimicrobiales bacterium]|nr:hypothetical protein [Elusimicrobiales bacterium]
MAGDAALGATEGQASGGTAEAAQTTGAAPDGKAEQGKEASSGKGTSRTTETSDSASHDDSESFFDPKSVPAELQPAYKQMQAAFTRGMQKLSSERSKAQFYDQFYRDPIGNIQRLAKQYGYQLTREQAAALEQAQGGPLPKDWQPQSWEEVFQKAQQITTENIYRQLQPLLSEVKKQKRDSIEKTLSEIDPGWQQYEQEMVDLIKEIPGLANHPERLYRLAVPPEVIESRATKKAIERLESKAKAAAGAGGSTTTKKPGAVDPNQRFASVQEAALWAQRKLEEEGKWPPK